MKKHYRKENDCLNCGTILTDKYCPHCGQENLQLKENFGHMMNHAISDYFHFDHQFFHTMKPLLFQPGKLTNEYMAGKRMQYLHPVKMYIFISLVFFVLLFKKAGDDKEKAVEHRKISKKEQVQVSESIKNNKFLSSGQKALIDSAIHNNTKVDSLRDKESKDEADKDDDPDYKVGGVLGANHIGITDDTTYAAYLTSQQKLTPDERDGFFTRLFERKMFAYKKYGSRAQEIFMEDFKHNIPKMMFVLLPLFALILSVAFMRNHKYYMEHLIFSFHLTSFLFLTLIISMLLLWVLPNSWGLDGWINMIVSVWITYYIYKSFRVYYQRSRWRTVSKMIGVSIVYTAVFSLCMFVLVLITALTSA